MHVLLASHRYHPVPGGTERVVQTIAEGLVRRGHQATVVTQEEPGVKAREEHEGVSILRIPVTTFAGIRFPHGYLRTLRSVRADVFHLHGNRIWNADFYFPRARRFSWPQVLTTHGFYQYAVNPGPLDRIYFERYLPRAARAFDVYAALTRAEADQMVSWGLPPERLALVPDGIPLGEFADPPVEGVRRLRARWGFRAEFVAVYVGGFFENKRVDRLIEAASRLDRRWGLVLIGRDIPDSRYNAAYCERLARDSGVEARFVGAVPRSEVVASLFAANAVVLGSSYEGFGLLPLEAMAAGRPFVAWATGAAPELAATGSGVAATTMEGFVDALRSFEDQERASRFGARGAQAIRAYSQDAMVDRYLDVYNRAIRRHSG